MTRGMIWDFSRHFQTPFSPRKNGFFQRKGRKRVEERREVTFRKERVKPLYIGYLQALDLPKTPFLFPRTGDLKICLGPTQFLRVKVSYRSFCVKIISRPWLAQKPFFPIQTLSSLNTQWFYFLRDTTGLPQRSKKAKCFFVGSFQESHFRSDLHVGCHPEKFYIGFLSQKFFGSYYTCEEVR